MNATIDSETLHRTLKESFGYDAFRPLQEEIIADALADQDVFALLPTGGGKSLCFQLPALLRDGLTVVVSPLIALMKDQVDALTAGGIAATFLNSTLESAESRTRMSGLYNSRYRLLYVAPERLMLSGFLETLKQWNISQFAIDEAHCISEWGHDFRPEYRQLARLRDIFPAAPFMALTATATERVRGDITKHLRLREPRCYVASFNRPNLFYRVTAKARPYEQTLSFVRQRRGECGIVYCASRKATEMVAERLVADGIAARPYHAGLDDKVRAQNQELFLRDEIHVICATIAFGMGINKPNVRFVLHYDLPKNVEGYYQETGRAGRDGLPSECQLLFSPGDVVKQNSFIDEKSGDEARVAREQLQTMVHYAECAGCRRAELLRYFGETFAEPTCGGCDNCLAPRETFDGTLATQKFLSCIFRLRAASRSGEASFGMNHIIEVLTGGASEKVTKWDHDKVSTYGIGKEHSRAEWAALGREIIRLGYCRQSTEKFSTLELTDAGRELLRSRRAVTLTRPPPEPERAGSRSHRAGQITCDEALFEVLRKVRKEIADGRDVPAYVIFGDATLREMARSYPTTEREMSRVSGVGAKKLEEFGALFMDVIAKFLRENPRQAFADSLSTFRGPPPVPRANDSSLDSWKIFASGKSVEEVAHIRRIGVGTVQQHLAEAIAAGQTCDPRLFYTAEEQARMEAGFAEHGLERLGPVKETLGEAISYGQLHLCRAFIQARLRGQ